MTASANGALREPPHGGGSLDRSPVPTFLGMPPFPVAARTALADHQLRDNLGRATTTIRDKRLRAIAELTDWADLRHAGATIKDDVLARLPELLVERAQQLNGGALVDDVAILLLSSDAAASDAPPSDVVPAGVAVSAGDRT